VNNGLGFVGGERDVLACLDCRDCLGYDSFDCIGLYEMATHIHRNMCRRVCGNAFEVFCLRIYDAATGMETHKALLLIMLFSLIVVNALICGRRLLPTSLYRVVFLFGCLYYIFISSGLFGHYYLDTQPVFFKTAWNDVGENYWMNRKGFLIPKLYLYWCYIRAGLPLFFELPAYEQLTVINIAQFLMGRMIEICAIGTVAERIAGLIKPVSKRDRIQKCQEER